MVRRKCKRATQPLNLALNMKPIVILPVLVLLLVSCFFFMRDRGARQQLAIAQKELGTMSNRLAEAQSNISTQELSVRTLQTNLAQRSEQFTNATTRLEKTMALVKQHETNIAAFPAKLAAADQRLVAADAERMAIAGKVEELTQQLQARDQQISQLTEKLTIAQNEGKQFADRAQKTHEQNMDLMLLLNDPVLLRQQISKIRRQYYDTLNSNPGAAGAPSAQSDTAESKGSQQMATRSHRPGGKGKLELQPDGSVRLVSPN